MKYCLAEKDFIKDCQAEKECIKECQAEKECIKECQAENFSTKIIINKFNCLVNETLCIQDSKPALHLQSDSLLFS